MKNFFKPPVEIKKEEERLPKFSGLDPKELKFPQTTFIRDIESRVLQSIVLQALAKIEGISFIGGTIFDHLLGREYDRIKGIVVEQDEKKHTVQVKVELNVCYGVKIPEKADEVQNQIVKEVSALTGLHVSSVHVVFKNLISPQGVKSENITETVTKNKSV